MDASKSLPILQKINGHRLRPNGLGTYVYVAEAGPRIDPELAQSTAVADSSGTRTGSSARSTDFCDHEPGVSIGLQNGPSPGFAAHSTAEVNRGILALPGEIACEPITPATEKVDWNRSEGSRTHVGRPALACVDANFNKIEMILGYP